MTPPILNIALDLPEGTRVSIQGLEGVHVESDTSSPGFDPVTKYWEEYLSDNGRKVFGAAAGLEDLRGSGYTFEDIAQHLSLDYESVKSMHRSTGRTAKRWRQDQGSEPPIRLVYDEYLRDPARDVHRTTYHLEPGVADAILALL